MYSLIFNRILTRVKSARGGSTSADWRASLHDCDIKPKVYFVSQHKPGHQWRRQKSSGSWRKTGVESDWVLWDENILNVQRKLWEPLDNKLKHGSIKACIINEGNKIIKYEILEKKKKNEEGRHGCDSSSNKNILINNFVTLIFLLETPAEFKGQFKLYFCFSISVAILTIYK